MRDVDSAADADGGSRARLSIATARKCTRSFGRGSRSPIHSTHIHYNLQLHIQHYFILSMQWNRVVVCTHGVRTVHTENIIFNNIERI